MVLERTEAVDKLWSKSTNDLCIMYPKALKPTKNHRILYIQVNLRPRCRRFDSCHSNQIGLWEAISEAIFFVFSVANFEGGCLTEIMCGFTVLRLRNMTDMMSVSFTKGKNP